VSARSRTSSTVLALAVCGLAYLYSAPYFPAINNPNENVRVQMTAAIVDFHTYRIDRIRERWGFTNDAACVDQGPTGARMPCVSPTPPQGMERHLYSVKAPLGSVLGVPAYAALRAIRGDGPITQADAIRACRLGGTILPILALLFAVRRFFEADLGSSPLALETGFFALALGSVAFGYALLFVSHTTSAVFAFVAFARLALARRDRRIGFTDAAFAGFLTSGTTALEYPALFVSVALSIFALVAVRSVPKLAAFAAGALVPVLIVMHFQAVAFGSPFRPGHLFVENPGFRVFHQQGFFGADALHLDAAARLLVDPRLGAFTTTPFLLLAPIGALALFRDERRRTDARFALGILAALYVPVVFLSNWDGGWVIGPRYLVTVLPFAIWLAAHGARAVFAAGPTLAAIPLGLFAASLTVSGIASTYYPHLPPEVRAPLADVYGPLIRDGFAPANVGLALGLPMSYSMLPLAILGAAIIVRCGASAPRRSVSILMTTLIVALVAISPQLAVSDRPEPVRAALAFIESHWSPPRR